jgi:methylmalonyl-CoA/ethylmalonyl-CoA epimerase
MTVLLPVAAILVLMTRQRRLARLSRLAAARRWSMQTRSRDLFQVAQHVNDLPRARAFYERLLNAPPVGIFDSPGMVFFQAGPVRLLLQYGATSALTYLKVDDVHATVESLRADDVQIVTEPYVIFRHSDDSLGPAGTDEWLSFVRDSEGNLLGLLSHQRPQAS